MLKILIPLIMGGLSRLAPKPFGRRAARLFQRPRKLALQPQLLSEPDQHVRLDTADYRVWGDASTTAILLHGWEGHHSQFHPLGLALRKAGYRVVVIDPPGHRGRAGELSSPVHFADALTAVLERIGGVDLVVGHSMGGLAALLAASQGAQIPRLVSISAPADAASNIHAIADWLKIGGAARKHMIRAIESVAGLPVAQVDVDHMSTDGGNPMLIIHDAQDRHVKVSHARRIGLAWPQAQRMITQGLGHSRILRDGQVHAGIVGFATGTPAVDVTQLTQFDAA